VGSTTRVFHILVKKDMRYVFAHVKNHEINRCYIMGDAYPLNDDELAQEIPFFNRMDEL
jgi:hypothetical protein